MVLFPTLLMISAAGAVWFHWYRGEDKAIDPKLAQKSTAITVEELRGHSDKLTSYIGERGWSSQAGRKGLRRTLAYLEGTLSPQNYGFRVNRANAFSWNGALWPTVWIEHARENEERWVEIRGAYDRSPEELAIILSAINELRETTPSVGLRFVFSAQEAPEDRRVLELENFPEEEPSGRLYLDGLECGEFSLYEKSNKSLWEEGKSAFPSVSGVMNLEFIGSGPVMDERGQLIRARWLRDFLKKAVSPR